MRKSRLSLFKSTSMLISVVGIIMIISTIIVVAYVGYSLVSSNITNDISSGTQYDELAELKASYSDLSVQFDNIKATYYAGSLDDIQRYSDAKIELSRANSAIENVQSALDADIPSNEVDSRIEFAKQKLQAATDAYNSL
ncbi:hypothetical protein [Methanobrevibacter sp.]